MKNIILSGLFSLLTSMMVQAAPTENGIVVYAEGQQTCYLFKQVPTVTYKSVGKDVFAVLSIEGKETPVVSLKLEGDSKLVIEYGEVDESTEVSSISSRKQTGKNGKYIVCGRLVIVKDGKLYNSDGTVVKWVTKKK